MSWFEDWFNSVYYWKLYGNHNEAEASSFTKALINYLEPATGSRIADFPCGEGRYSRLLAHEGFDVSGFDLSPRNIKEALKYETTNLHFFIHDMRQPFYINYFDYVFNIFTSLGYFDTGRMDIRVLKNFHTALKRKGRIVIDFLNSDYVLKHLNPNQTVDRDDLLFTLAKKYDGQSIVKNIEVRDGDNTHYFVERVRAYSLADFKSMLTICDFKLVDTFGNYRLEPFDVNSSERLILIAEKN
jgi:SAM-dependent methyltransferase